jgi:hypothetical protein
MRLFLAITVLVTMVALCNCGGGSQPQATVVPISLAIAPSTATLDQGATQQFTVTTTGGSQSGVVLAIQEGASGGTLSAQGLYTAPAAAGTYHVIATSTADSSKTTSAAITVRSVGLSLNPTSIDVDQGGTIQFTATVTGTTNTSVSWSVQEGAARGTIDAGKFTAPNSQGVAHIVATSSADSSKTATATVTVPPIFVTVILPGCYYENRVDRPCFEADIDQGGSRQFEATISGAVNHAVTWSSSAGSITSDGLLTAPPNDHVGIITVTATSAFDPAQSGVFNVYVLPIHVEVSPALAGMPRNQTRAFTARVSGTQVDTRVTWSVQEGAAGGSLSGAIYTAPASGAGPFHVIATSVADPTKSATSEIRITTAGFTSAGNMTIGRYRHTATLLRNGKVLLAGGNSPGVRLPAELYDPATNTFAETGLMLDARASHSATLLNNGMVLLAGGLDHTGNPTDTAELYDPATEKFTATGRMLAWHVDSKTILLADGRVLIFGDLSEPEIYDPATGTFSRGPALAAPGHIEFTLTPLVSGKYLLAAGRVQNFVNGGAVVAWGPAELFDPISNSFSLTSSPLAVRTTHSAARLNNGKVLLLGGFTECRERPDSACPTRDAELYDPATAQFTSTGQTVADHRFLTTATLLPNGQVLVVGDSDIAELYDAVTGQFTITGSPLETRYGHTATLLPNGKVLITGGVGAATLASAELY